MILTLTYLLVGAVFVSILDMYAGGLELKPSSFVIGTLIWPAIFVIVGAIAITAKFKKWAKR